MMKLYSLYILGICIFICQSCSKNSGSNAASVPSSNSINVTLSTNQTYQLNLTGAGDVGIFRQASHFQTSTTVTDRENASVIYKYIPATGYVGNDQVMLSMTNSSNSSRVCPLTGHTDNTNTQPTYSTTYTTINITVSN